MRGPSGFLRSAFFALTRFALRGESNKCVEKVDVSMAISLKANHFRRNIKKHIRHIQPNNKPSPKRFRPRIRSPSGRGRSDSSENGGSEAGGEYDPNNDGKYKSTFKAKILFINIYVLDV